LNNNILISIITVNYNGADYLDRLFDGVKKIIDLYDCIEHIIIDGASTDSSLKKIKHYANKSKNIIYISEKDNGIYDAMNKGITIANGRFILHINSDDEVQVGKDWNELIDILKKNILALLVVTRVPLIENNAIVRTLPSRPINNLHKNFGYHFPHQGTLFNKLTFKKYGKYPVNIGYIADKIYAYKLLDQLNSKDIIYTDLSISVQNLGGVSSSNLSAPLKTAYLTFINRNKYSYKYPVMRILGNLFFKSLFKN